MINMKRSLLSVAVASGLVWSVGAQAVVNLDANPVVPAVYASETVAASTKTTGGAFEILGAGNVIDVSAAVGFGFTQGTSFYVRYDLTGAVFETAKVAGNLALAGATTPVISLAQGGAEDQAFVIFEVVDNGAAVATTQALTLANADLALTGTGNASIQMRIFANAPDAVNQTGALVTKSGALVNQASAITTVFTPNNPTADVDDLFTDFVGDATVASLGSIKLTLSTTALAANDGLAVARADVITDATSTYVVTGDFSNALPAGAGAVAVNTAANCGGVNTVMTVDAGGTKATLTGTGVLLDATAMQLCLTPDPATSMAATSAYSATLTPAAGANGTYAAQTGTLGMILRNGTTLEIPYITTFSDYNQRLVMTNNSATATTYSCTFTPEAGVTATAGTGASGSIPAKTTVVVKATDLVTLTGSTRTAARCVLLSQSTNIDAATTQVNLSDKSTDTVIIN